MAINEAASIVEKAGFKASDRGDSFNLNIVRGPVRIDLLLEGAFRFWVTPYVEIDEQTVRKVADEFGLRMTAAYHYITLRTGRFFGQVAYLGRRWPKDTESLGFVSSKYARKQELFDALLTKVYEVKSE